MIELELDHRSFLLQRRMGCSWLEVLVGLVIHPWPESLLAYACCLLLLLLLYFKLKKKSNNIMPTNWPVVGMFPAVLVNLDNPHEWLTDVLRDCNGTLHFRGPWFLGMDFVGTSDPASVNHVSSVNFPNYPKGGEFSEIFDILGNGIFNADGESWRSQRRRAHCLIAHPRFRSFVAERSRDKVENGLLPLLGRLAEQQVEVDLQDVFLRLAFDMTCTLVFGVDPGCLSIDFPPVPFARAMDDAMEAVFLRHFMPSPYCWKLMKWLGMGKEKKLAAARGVVDDFVAESMAKSREESRGTVRERSLLASYADGGDDGYIRDTAVNFMLAGRDTVAAALSWLFWLLSKNPAAGTKILDELGELHPSPSIDGAEELGELVYLHAALCEALRLYPPVPFERKGPVRSDVLPSGYKVPSGGKVLLSAYSMGRMEGVWGKDCLEFRPERWITEQGRLRHEPSHKFFSFNCGPRTCVGKDIAFSQMKVVVAAMLSNFDVEPAEGYVVKPKLSVILLMRNGWKVRIKKKRKKNH